MEKRKTILLVDDEPDILEIVRYNLRSEGYNLLTAENGLEAVKLAQEAKPELIILDVMMPVMDGIEACQQIREISELSETVIAFFTARGEDYSQMAGFDAGADDYIIKPIKPKVLITKVKALLRRYKGEEFSSGIIQVGDIIIDRNKYIVLKNEKELVLPKKEFELLALLASQPGQIVHRQDILSTIWGNETETGNRTIDVHIRKLRIKLGKERFTTVKGIGYKFE